MLASVARYIQGYLKIRISGDSTERFINACRHRGIALWDIRVCPDHSCEMYLNVSSFRELKPILKKTGTRLVILEKSGLAFFASRMRRRKLFLAGIAAAAFLLYVLSLFIWQIDLEGNHARTDETLSRYLAEQGVKIGTRKSKISCPEIVNKLREKYDNIIWVSVSLDGCRLVVQVKENEDGADIGTSEESGENGENGVTGVKGVKEEKEGIEDGKNGSSKAEQQKDGAESEPEPEKPYDLVADFDGVIVSCIIREGIGQKKIGDTVKKGDVLVSGQIPVENDADEIINYQYRMADADIIAAVSIPYEDTCPNEKPEKEYYDVYKMRYYVKIGKKRFFLGELRNRYEHFELYGIYHNIAGFPVSAGYQKIIPYKLNMRIYSQNEQNQILSRRFLQYQKELEKKGVEIIENDVKIYTGSDAAAAKGILKVQKPIGVSRPAKILSVPERKEEETGE